MAAMAMEVGESSSSGLYMGSVEVSEDFRVWAQAKMLAFNGNDDLTMVEFLWGLSSGGEVAEYCNTLWRGKPGVSSFVVDFLKRKAEELNRKPAKKGKRKSTGGGAGQAAASSAPAGAGTRKAAENAAVVKQGVPDTLPVGEGWNTVAASDKKGKKKGKGKGKAEAKTLALVPGATYGPDDE